MSLQNSKHNWTVVDSYFHENGLTKHHKSSFDYFVETIIPEIINEHPPIDIEATNKNDMITVKCSVIFGSTFIDRPQFIETDSTITYVTPKESRLRGLTYSAPLYIDIKKITKKTNIETGEEREETKDEKILLAWVPIMLQSSYCMLHGKLIEEYGECGYDQGGYFIVNGTEKVLINQERMNNNTFYVFPNKDDNIIGEIRSCDEFSKRPPSLLKIVLTQHGIIRIVFMCVKKPIPLFILFRALGIETDKEIFSLVSSTLDNKLCKYLQESLEEAYHISCTNDALEWIGKNSNVVHKTSEEKIVYAKLLLQKDFLPHIGIDDMSITKKSYYLGYMINKMLEIVSGNREYDDRDHYGNKRVDVSGVLLGTIFRNGYSRVYNECNSYIDKRLNSTNNYNKDFNISSIIESKTITKELTTALSTGNWGTKTFNKTGVSQVLSRLNYMAAISHLRRMSTPITKNGTTSKPRQLHNTQFLSICPAETPEGGSCLIGDTIITLQDGSFMKIEDMYNGQENIVTYNHETLEESTTSITNYFRKLSNTIKITTMDESSVVCTLDHKFLSFTNNKLEWKLAENFSIGDRIVKRENDTKFSHYTCYLKCLFNKTIKYSFEKFEKEYCLSNGFIALPITSKTNDEYQYVYDFTTLSDNHSFIANGFFSSNCGLVKNMSMICHFSNYHSPDILLDIFQDLGLQDTKTDENMTNVFVNGKWVGFIGNITENINYLRLQKRNGILPFDVAIVPPDQNNKEIRTYTDAGRVCHPLLIVEDNKVKLTMEHIEMLKDNSQHFGWKDLLTCGIIEYLDTNEEESSLICNKIEDLDKSSYKYYTHCNIDSSLMFGAMASIIPFPDHNQAPRNCYQCLDRDSQVLMSDNSYKSIGDIEIGEKVITFNPETMEYTSTRVVYKLESSTEKEMYEIETTNGKKIKATFDHKFMTNNGWKEVGELDETRDKVAMIERFMINKFLVCILLWIIFINYCDYDVINGFLVLICLLEYVKIEYHYTSYKTFKRTKITRSIIADITTESENHSFVANGFCVHNSAMGKQAVGIYASNYQKRMDTMGHTLMNVQKPLANPKTAKHLNFEDIPSGVNAIVAIACYSGLIKRFAPVVA
jgi:DNA-directed RNA polymerase beta subunit